ncbi:hypothetical protein XELAEV_180210952mg, partial [Xenopus laevis]
MWIPTEHEKFGV